MKHLIPKKNKIIKVDYPTNPGCMVPIICIRYYQGTPVYVGETVNYYGGRHLRPRCRDLNCTLEELDNGKFPGWRGEKREEIRFQILWDNTDTIRVLNAPKNDQVRRRWEAKLVCWLNPKLQKVKKYIRHANLDIKSKKNLKIIKEINGDSILGRITTYSTNILKEIRDYKKFSRIPPDQWPVSGYGGKTYPSRCMSRALREHSQMIGYKKNFLSEKLVFPDLHRQVNQICDQITKKVNDLDVG